MLHPVMDGHCKADCEARLPLQKRHDLRAAGPGHAHGIRHEAGLLPELMKHVSW